MLNHKSKVDKMNSSQMIFRKTGDFVIGPAGLLTILSATVKCQVSPEKSLKLTQQVQRLRHEPYLAYPTASLEVIVKQLSLSSGNGRWW